MAGLKLSFKHVELSKATQNMIIVLTIGSVLTAFSLAAAKVLVTKLSYQNKVITEKRKARDRLKSNLSAVNSLEQAYKVFEGASESIIGTGDSNSKVVLDALPGTYDFPALVSSLEGLINNGGHTINGIEGTDEEVANNPPESGQAATTSTTTATAASTGAVAPGQTVDMPFSVDVQTSYAGAQKLITDFDKTIRPIKITKLEMSGSDDDLQVVISAITYYQAGLKLTNPLKEIR